MNLASKDIDGSLIVTVEDTRIDAAGAIRFKEDMRNATAGASGRVVLDLRQVEFIDSSGLGAIVAAMKHLGERRLDLAGLSPDVNRVFRLTRMDTVFRLYETLDAALKERPQ